MKQQAGIYVHIPFCERKCTYCNFNTTDFVAKLAPPYIDAVCQEIAYWGSYLTQYDGSRDGSFPTVDSIFLGGGTPSIVEAEQIAQILEACRAAFAVDAEAEVTIEINPGTFGAAKIEGWRAAGINRASVGVQSFIDRELLSLSRTHTAVDASRTVEALRTGCFDNISLDLIAGLPEQSLADWESNLSSALEFRPEHLSLYLLEVKEGTQLFAQIKRGSRLAPDDDLASEMYRITCAATRGSGFEHYEISNFAVDRARLAAGNEALQNGNKSYRAKHNMKYWTGAPFYGMGCGAHSYDGHARWANISKTENYIAQVAKRGTAVAERRELSKRDLAVEALFMRLRLRAGVDLAEFQTEYDADAIEQFGGDFSRLEDAGLLQVSGGRLALTERGLLLSNEVFVALI